MDAAYDMARRTDKPGERRFGGEPRDDPADLPACPAGEPPAVEAHWRALISTCDGMQARHVPVLLEYCRCLADLEEARKQVQAGGAMVLTKGGDLAENPWADRERKLRAQSIQIGKQLDGALDGRVVNGAAAEAIAEATAKAEAEAEAEAKREAAAKAERAAKAKAKRAEAAEKRKATRERKASEALEASE